MVVATKETDEVKANRPVEVYQKQPSETTTKQATNTTDQQSKGSAEIRPANQTDNPEAQQAFGFLRNVDNGELYNIYKAILIRLSEDQNVKKYLPYAIKLLNLPTYSLPNKNISVKYNQETVTVNEEYFPKTIDEASLVALSYLIEYAFKNEANNYSTLLSGFTNALINLKNSMVALADLGKNADVKNDLQEFADVLDGYIKSWSQFKNEYPDPDKLKEEVVKMATADATQTGTQTVGQAGSIFSNLLDAVYGILGSIVDALKNYATEIAEVLVAGMLGYSVIRYGRQMINGLVNMVSALF